MRVSVFSVVSRLMRSIVLLMEFRVLGSRHGEQVRQAVVSSDVIDVMDDPPARNGAVLLLPDEHMLATVSTSTHEDLNVTGAVQIAATLPPARLFWAEQAGVVPVDESQRMAFVVTATKSGEGGDLGAFTAPTFAQSGRALPVRRWLALSRLFHTAVRLRPRPMASNELRGSGRVTRAGNDRLTAAAGTGLVAHRAMVAHEQR